MTFLWRLASRTSVPAAAALASQYKTYNTTNCEEGAKVQRQTASPQQPQPGRMPKEPPLMDQPSPEPKSLKQAGMQQDAAGDFHGLFPIRQLWRPLYEYPLWDANWDEREPPSSGNLEGDRQRMKEMRNTGVTRHLILIRHGQYDETHKEDKKRVLTKLGQEQAHLTGERLAQMIQGAENDFGPCRVKVLRVSGMTRARETADIIATYLPGVELADPDPELNEGRPCHHIPGGRFSDRVVKTTDENHPRIEGAFRKYFFRANPPPTSSDAEANPQDDSSPQDAEQGLHEFEVIVCHANVIRYFLMRALQLPPEAWLRYCPFNCSLTYLTIRPTGSVSCRMLGDIGHLPYAASSFSQHHGFNW